MTKRALGVLSGSILLFLLVTSAYGQEAELSSAHKSKRVSLTFHVMSQCTFGNQVMNGISPVLKKIGDYIDFRLEFIGNHDDGKPTSMHGDSEVKGDTIMLCAQKHLGEAYEYFALIDCMNQDMKSIPGNWETCAREAGFNSTLSKLRKCYEGSEGRRLLKASFELSQRAGVRGSPTIFLNDQPYGGGRGEKYFMRFVCNELPEGSKPQACADIPPPVEFEAIILEDKRCTYRSCDTARLQSSFGSMFPGMKIRKVDWSEEEGKQLHDDEGITYLPVVLFGNDVQKGDGYARLERFLKPSKSGNWKVFAGRAQHDPYAEMCDNMVDDTGNGKVDCADDSCANNLLCRAEVKGQLEVFVMSECPYGIKALNAMEGVVAAFGDEIKFSVHFIGDEQDGKPTSIHGQSEVDEDIRELCVINKYPQKFMTYILCRNKNIRDTNWQACASHGIDAAVIEKCLYGRGAKMLLDDIKLAKAMSITGSPTWIANGRHKFGGTDAATIQKYICQHNPEFSGCQADLTSPFSPDGAKDLNVEKKRKPERKREDMPESSVITTASGLQYVDHVVGTGATPTAGEKVTVHYTGTLKDGTKFDSSVDRGHPFVFPIGIGRVIKGWEEGVMSMKVGGKRKLIIPPDLGYGARGAGGLIPPNATLIFEVELLRVQ
jgi:FKBP-type peptidyl-prolyl cis-trans isomerase/glutaredoxin